jgi:hypothetical protein
MAQRWRANKPTSTSVFIRLAERLRTLHTKCVLDPSYVIDTREPLYETTSTQREASRRHWVSPEMMATYVERNRAEPGTMTPFDGFSKLLPSFSDDSLSQAHDAVTRGLDITIGTPEKLHWDIASNIEPSEGSLTDSNLLAISESLACQEFTSMDRVVTMDDMAFMNWDFS